MAEIQRHTGPGCRTLQSSTSVWQSLHWSQCANSRISGGVAPHPGRPDPSHLRTAGAGAAAAAEDPDRESGEIAVDAVPANDVDATSKRPRDGSRGHSTKVSGREHSTRCCLIVNTHILKQFEPCSHSCGFCHCNACSTSRLYRCIVRMQDDRSPWSPSGNVRTIAQLATCRRHKHRSSSDKRRRSVSKQRDDKHDDRRRDGKHHDSKRRRSAGVPTPASAAATAVEEAAVEEAAGKTSREGDKASDPPAAVGLDKSAGEQGLPPPPSKPSGDVAGAGCAVLCLAQ